MSTKKRFSKASLVNDLQARVDRMAARHKFDGNNGWAQVDGKYVATIVAYGEWTALCDLIDELSE
jgi:hypothetical protein